ncbi:glycosyltransferase family 2 protein [Peribacillus kribbensis]|uniref:glycosyltransferase family 2 protein n=1 Tax=Peribacillus kribbensis TaxID=356658 RepID=UPI00041F49BB|nr:glycosyltransferase family 2 protein [Peribacillus kribbensis]
MIDSSKTMVSVIIPTFGRPKLLLRAINSVLNQSYKNIEIIIVDDNNPGTQERDETGSVLKKYIDEERIRYLHLDKNSGGAIARNKGVEICTGELICFLDDDDEFLPNKIELQIEKYFEFDCRPSVIGGYANILDGKGNLKRVERNEVSGDVFKFQLGKNVCTTSIAMINKKVFIKAGGFTNVPSSQEHTLFIKIFNENPLYYYVNEPVVNIYHHDGNRISTGRRKAEGAILLHNFVASFYNKLTKKEKKEVDNAHYINIIRAFMHTKKHRIEAYKYLIKLMKNKKIIDKEALKCLAIILLGINRIEKVKNKLTNV